MLTNNVGSKSKMAPQKPSEEDLGRMWDRCLIDTAFKSVGGLTFGTILSFLFFKRKAWPITLGLGIGLGAGYSNCRHQVLWRRFGHHGPFKGGPTSFKGSDGWGSRRPPWMKKEEKKPESPVEGNDTAKEEPAPKPTES